MYSMKEKYRQNTKLKSSTSSYPTRHHYNDDEYSERHSRKHASGSKHERHRSPGMTKQDKYYELMKRDRRDRYPDEYDRRDEKRSSKAVDSKYFRRGHDDHGHHYNRADCRDLDARDHKVKSSSARDREYSMERKNSVFANLSQVVRKARESRHNGKAGEEDETNSKRWSHSGYKELYHGDRRADDDSRRSRKDEPEPNLRSRNYSRSPTGNAPARKLLTPARRHEGARIEHGKITLGNANQGLRSDKLTGKVGTSLKTPVKKPLPLSASGSKTSGGKGKVSDDDEDPDMAAIKALRAERERLLGLGKHKKPGPSSYSDSPSSESDTGNRRPGPGDKGRPLGKSASASGSRSRSRSRSRSFSSSSRSSDDEDVLELHPAKRRKVSSKTNSSSDYDSRSDSSAISCLASNSGRRSSSSSSFSTGSRNSVTKKVKAKPGKSSLIAPAAKITPSARIVKAGVKAVTSDKSNTTTKPVRVTPEEKSSANGKAKGTTARAGKANVAQTGTKKSSMAKVTAKQTEEKKDSESDSDSSSDSDAEPRMSLSERFAKLTQMHTDKREFAKPVIAANEMDTKMRVVRDLRNPDTRILVNHQPHAPSDIHRRSRPKTPDMVGTEGARRYTSDDRRRHFERMDRDEPSERPSDWSDPRVRFTYYRDRGYFNERPLEFDEYVKWEKWWFEYRDWLATEGYYDKAAAAAAAAQERRPGVDGRAPSGWYYDRRSDHPGRHNPPVFDARERLARPPPAASHPGHAPMPHARAPYFPMDPNAPSNSRSIGRAADGSLVINVRRGQNPAFAGAGYGYRGRDRPY